MEEVTVQRGLSAPPDGVRNAVQDVKPFMQAAGFDEVHVDNNTIRVSNQVGIVSIELTLEVVDHSDADLAYQQQDGLFEEMQTTYTITPSDPETKISATTSFALDIAIVGEVLDSTIIKRQRRKELSAQFDWLEDVGSDYTEDISSHR